MRTRICVVLLCVVTAVLRGQTLRQPVAFAQATVDGTWRAESTPPGIGWAAVLRVDGLRLTGAVSSCSSVLGTFEIFDGTTDGKTLTFKCISGDGRHTLTFTGTIDGDEIAFTWEKQSREGGPPRPDDAIFGASAARRFTATRVARGGSATDAQTIREAVDRTRTRPAVTFDRIVRAAREPQNWLTYSGNLQGHRHSPLAQITRENVKDLELAWVAPTSSRVQSTPLVVDGVMYTTRNSNDVVALDARSGRVLWVYPYTLRSPGAQASGGGRRPNRGLAILGGTLFLGTLDAYLLAIDALSGKLLWETRVADARDPACEGGLCYVITLAPLIVKNKVVVGVGGGEGRTRGFIAAYDAVSGKEAWRFHTVPAAGEPGNSTWAGDSWKTGGAAVWATGVFDPELNLTYWGTGNPYPPWDGSTRAGDNLHSNSVVALDADTGTLKWHYQFTPHDVQDWDSAQTPLLVDLPWQGKPRKAMLWANRNGLLYVLDRTTGDFLMGKPFVEVNWMNGFDTRGRPIRVRDQVFSEKNPIRPGSATNWNPSSYSTRTGLFYVAGWERGGAGEGFVRGKAYSAVRAFDPVTGDRKWEFRIDDAIFSRGVMTTASDLLFTGTSGDPYSDPNDARRVDRLFYALDARTGQALWKFGLAASIQSPPITYSVGGKQYVAVAANDALFAFALRD